MTQAGDHSKPALVTDLNNDTIRVRFNRNANRRLTSRTERFVGSNLYEYLILVVEFLDTQISTIELGYQCLAQVLWRNITVIDPSFHIGSLQSFFLALSGVDYNQLSERCDDIRRLHALPEF